MQINYTIDAFASLIRLVNYIEDKNTEGAGLRWLNRYESFLKEKLLLRDQIKTCNNFTLKKLGLRCIYFNEWVIAFSINEDFTLIEALIHKSRISD